MINFASAKRESRLLLPKRLAEETKQKSIIRQMLNMIDLSNPNINFADFHRVKAEKKQLKERYFVPFCRVLPEYKHMFKKEHKVVKMPAEWYELFQKNA